MIVNVIDLSWEEARENVNVKLLTEEGELYILVESADRLNKECSIVSTPNYIESRGGGSVVKIKFVVKTFDMCPLIYMDFRLSTPLE